MYYRHLSHISAQDSFIITILFFLSGADTLIYLALLPPNTTNPKGEFVAERKVIGFP